MSFRWSPLPHVLLDGGGGAELALNAVVYLSVLALTGSCLWLAGLAWAERER